MHSFTRNHQKAGGPSDISEQEGVITFSAWLYDLIVRWFVMRGKEQAFRNIIADLTQIQTGEAVLDVGCGTGTQALVVKRRIGETGRVCGLDPSVPLLSAARRKARRVGLAVDFQQGGIGQISFPPQSFDVVLSTFMMHHVSDKLKRQGLAEVARVLKPGGRLLIVDFQRSEEHHDKPEQFGVGVFALQDLPALLKEAGFSQIESGEIPFRVRSVAAAHTQYGFIRAKKS
jgi:ubiquinone/menaquinone biosynthesis C-methylase UbiE